MPKPTRNVVTRKKLKQLQTHPLQALYYHNDCTPADDAALAADMEKRGQRDAVHVLPPGNRAGLPAHSVIDGHRRIKAAESLGWDEVDVVVRWDLVDVDAATVDIEFLSSNFQRRQLKPIDQARIVKGLHELEKGRAPGKLRAWEQPEARDRVGKAIDMSGRNLQRYWRVLDTPIEVQHAVRDGHLKLVVGERVATLPKATQQAISERLRNLADGERPSDVVDEYLGSREGRPQRNVHKHVVQLARALHRAEADLGGRLGEVAPRHVAGAVPTLRQGQRLIDALLAAASTSDQPEEH